MMKVLTVFFLVYIFQPNVARTDKGALLSGGDKKGWYLFAKTPNDPRETCRPENPISRDNSYIFFNDGTFEFDNGAITEDVNCKYPECCSDFKNLAGRWELDQTQDRLKITALKANDQNISPSILFNAKIERLDESVLKLSQTDAGTNTVYTLEFHAQ